ncbi:MAG: type II secretion system protein [Brachyspira sp.]|nr:type II secretion system protein [Brachyspira sp.]
MGAGNKPCSAATPKKQQNGFTLAEVLITLGIIGVVAAMTMPTLMNKTNNKELHTAFLKTYSELNQVAGLFKADYGISISEYTAAHGSLTSSAGLKSEIASKIFAYYKGSRNLTKDGQGTDDGEGNFLAWYNMANLNGSGYSGGANNLGANSSFLCDNSAFTNNLSGALMILNDAPKEGDNGPVICVDVNGKKKPNRFRSIKITLEHAIVAMDLVVILII